MPIIHLAPRRLADYEASVDPAVLAALQRRAEPLAGLRVLHISAGPFGSTVADMLTGLVPLQRDLGIAADWHLLRGDAPRLWLALYEALAGGTVHWGKKERQTWLTYAERHAGVLDGDYDLVIAHDPQAVVLAEVATGARHRSLGLALSPRHPGRTARSLGRCAGLPSIVRRRAVPGAGAAAERPRARLPGSRPTRRLTR